MKNHLWNGNLLYVRSADQVAKYMGGLFLDEGEIGWRWKSAEKSCQFIYSSLTIKRYPEFDEAKRIVEVTGKLEGWL